MARIKEITVSLDMTVQPKQFQSVKLGITVTEEIEETLGTDKGMNDLTNSIDQLRYQISDALRIGLHEEIEHVYGKAAADYCVNQAGSPAK